MTLPKHMPALDGLRGVAILLVVLTHVAGGWQAALSILENTLEWPPTFAIPLWLHRITGGAEYGVQLFFVLSAFTLTVRAVQDGEGSLGRYALRRIARVGPGYWLAGIGYTLVAGLGPRLWASHGVGLSDLAVAAAFGSAWQGGPALAVVPGGWSVSCEVSFYLALPLLLWIIGRRIWCAVLLTGLTLVLMTLPHVILPDLASFPGFVHPLTQAPVFLFGVTAAMVAMRYRIADTSGAALVLLAVAIVVLPFSPLPLQPYLQFAAVTAVVVILIAAKPPRLLASRLMCKVGQVSYSVYLVHFAILGPSLLLAEKLFPGDDWRTMTTHLIVTCSVSFLLAVRDACRHRAAGDALGSSTDPAFSLAKATVSSGLTPRRRLFH